MLDCRRDLALPPAAFRREGTGVLPCCDGGMAVGRPRGRWSRRVAGRRQDDALVSGVCCGELPDATARCASPLDAHALLHDARCRPLPAQRYARSCLSGRVARFCTLRLEGRASRCDRRAVPRCLRLLPIVAAAVVWPRRRAAASLLPLACSPCHDGARALPVVCVACPRLPLSMTSADGASAATRLTSCLVSACVCPMPPIRRPPFGRSAWERLFESPP